MGIPVDIDGLARWQAYGTPESWPAAPEHLFIVEAMAHVLRAKFGLDASDVAEDPWSAGYRNEVANSLARLLMRGSLIAYAQPIGDSRMSAIVTEWTPGSAFAAIATGMIARPHKRARQHPHWVFVGRKEVEILGKVYAATQLLFSPEEAGPTEALAEAVLANLGKMAGNPAATPRDGASAVMQRLLPNSGWTLHPHDRDQFAEALVPWLFRQLDKNPGCGRGKDEFSAIAVLEHPQFMTGRIFDLVWAKAKRMATGPQALDEHKRHAPRFLPGPKAAR